MESAYQACARHITRCQALIVTAGAGMGVDSGMPDFRGSTGWWKQKRGLSFVTLGSPENFLDKPELTWGFYGHRLNMYRETQPHRGFGIILSWIKRFNLDYFVATSNIDGHFQKAGFSPKRIYECHGSIHYLQCTDPYCADATWKNQEQIEVSADFKASQIPKCPYCGKTARPNVLMFTDRDWVPVRYQLQKKQLDQFVKDSKEKQQSIVILEIGAGTAIPTMREMTVALATGYPYARAIRVNPTESQIDPPHIGLPVGGLEALEHIDAMLPKEQEVATDKI